MKSQNDLLHEMRMETGSKTTPGDIKFDILDEISYDDEVDARVVERWTLNKIDRLVEYAKWMEDKLCGQ